jgi:hypothetical protein
MLAGLRTLIQTGQGPDRRCCQLLGDDAFGVKPAGVREDRGPNDASLATALGSQLNLEPKRPRPRVYHDQFNEAFLIGSIQA